jgi:hypothetical protein
LRDIQAFRHIRREVDLAVEAGKRLHISLGRGNINDLQGGAHRIDYPGSKCPGSIKQ